MIDWNPRRARAASLAVIWTAGLVGLAACRSASPPVPDTALSTGVEADTAALADTGTAPEVVVAPPEPARAWWRDVVGYEIFVRSFQDSNGDGIGDLQGIIDRLDYLKDLGIGVVWLMPIHPSPSYHGYDVIDYRDVNPEYGTLATLDKLVAEGKARGIRIIIDLLLNHSSDRNPWFLESRKGPSSPKRDWYTWRSAVPEGWARPWDGAPVWHSLGDSFYYGLFWSGMPDLALTNPAVEKEMTDVMDFWLARGLAGFRLDAIRYLVETPAGDLADTAETHAYLRRMRASLGARHPDALFVGEAWTSAEDQAVYYGAGDELHMTFSFDMAAAIVECARDGVRSRLNQIIDRSSELFGKDRGFEAPFLTNHDMPRVMRNLGWDGPRMRVAAATMLASPGTPWVYYGEEIGMVGGLAREDENKRTPMHWTPGENGGFTTGTPWWPMKDERPGVDVATQAADPTSLLSHYKRLIAARKASAALSHGDQLRLDLKAGRGVLGFVRSAGSERVLVLVNFDGDPVPSFTVPVEGKPRVLLAEGVDGELTRVEASGEAPAGIAVPGMGARSFAWVALD